ncbi:MAG: BlaI/MecI/CopY family transcriptional regulator [Candidatus Hodarchaeota archaeon]
MDLQTMLKPPFKSMIKEVFASIKNNRRRLILDELNRTSSAPLPLIQEKLNQNRFSHSRSTISNWYLQPLQESGLVRQMDGVFEITPLGRRINREIRNKWWFDRLPRYGSCHEEFLILALMNGEKSREELSYLIPESVLSRVISRARPFVRRKSVRVYSRTKKPHPPEDASPKEREAFDIIWRAGDLRISDLLKLVSAHQRTVYKVLRRLKERGFVSNEKLLSTLELNEEGKKLADTLWKIAVQVLLNGGMIRPVINIEELTEKVIRFLRSQMDPVSEFDMVERCLDPFFKKHYGRSITPEEFIKLKNRLKMLNIITGTPYHGYVLSKEFTTSEEPVKEPEIATIGTS